MNYHSIALFFYLFYCMRYYQKNEASLRLKLINYRELFNLCHFFLKNNIERIYSVI